MATIAAILAAGCSHQRAPVTKPAAPAPRPIVHAVDSAPAGSVPVGAPAPVVNIFGEVGGMPRPVPAVAGEAGFQQHTVSDEGFDADVTADPTGRWLAFTSTRHSHRSDIYLQRVDGTSVIQLTSDPADDAHPAFSPDGRWIAFASSRSGNWDLYLTDLDGKSVQQLTSGPSHEMHPSFSPDGMRLVYCALSPRSDQWELWLVDLTTLERKFIGHGLFPAWSPRKDVDRIAFQRARQRGSRWFSLWTLDLVDGEPRRLTEVAASSNAAIVSPAWCPEGRRLAFTAIVEPAGRLATAAERRQELWVINEDGTGRQRLTDRAATNLSPHWTVDNRIYFTSDRSGRENIWSVRVDAGAMMTAAAEPGGRGAAKPPAAHASTDANEAER